MTKILIDCSVLEQPQRKLTQQDIADSAMLGNIESQFNACMHQEHCKWWKKEAEAENQFSTRDDAERLKSVARGMSYNDHGEAVWKHTLMEIAVRLEAGGYTAPPTVKESLITQPQVEQGTNMLTPELIHKLALQAGAARFYPEQQAVKQEIYLVSQGFLEKFAELLHAEGYNQRHEEVLGALG